MQRILNNADNIVDEMLEGFLKAHGELAERTENPRAIRSKFWEPGRVGVVTGGGSGHKPAFIGYIYGPLAPVVAPADAPPLFIAFAADDNLVASGGYGIVDSWKAAKRPVEFHMFERGGHGFGMYPKETTSTGWFEAYVRWLRMHGMVK